VLANAVLVDAGEAPLALFVAPHGADAQEVDRAVRDLGDLGSGGSAPAWVWYPDQGAMPPLPRRRPRSSAAGGAATAERRQAPEWAGDEIDQRQES
jgi:hypothetical protein